MKLSIIIPTFNEEKLLQNLLEQISNSNLKKKYQYEVIVSDGKSNDSTIDIAKNFADKVIVHSEQKRQLISEGRNNGAKIAEGEIFVFINADIKFENFEKFLEKIYQDFLPSKNIAMTCAVKVFPEDEIFSDKIFLNFYNYYFYFLNLIGMGMGRGECQVVRKKDFDLLGGYNEKMAAGEDFDFFKRLRNKGKIMFDMSCHVYESPRRYRKYGHLKVFFTWLGNALSVILFKKSYSEDWIDIR